MNDELISAYIDGELDAEKRALVEHWLSSDTGAAARLKRFQDSDAAIKLALPRTSVSAGDPLAMRILQAEDQIPGRASARVWGGRIAALAAACVLGVVIGRAVGGADETDAVTIGRGMQAMLDETPSGELRRVGGADVQIVMSVLSDAGEACRLYNMGTADATIESLACRHEGGWRVRSQSFAYGAAHEGYVTAGSTAVTDAALASLGAAQALDAQQERSLIARQWRTD